MNWWLLGRCLMVSMSLRAEPLVIEGKLGEGWTWRRENPAGWRIRDGALEIRVEPGNMWGPANDARNVLVRRVPNPLGGEVRVSVTVSNKPTEQYEQVDLV